MGIYLGIRPVGALALVAAAAPVSGAVADAVAPELPPSQSVTATDTATNAALDSQASGQQLSHQVILDPEAASIVYQTAEECADAASLSPDEAARRRRAYFRALNDLKADRTLVPATDRKA